MLIVRSLARELAAQERQIEAAVALLDEGATVPFIARYRKEATGGLDDTQLRLLEGHATSDRTGASMGHLRTFSGCGCSANGSRRGADSATNC